jgi:hypothetical protein
MNPALKKHLLTAALLTTSIASFAQFSGGGMSGGGMGGGRSNRGGNSTDSAERATVRSPDLATAAAILRDRLFDMRLQLMITPEQAPAWSKFSNAVWNLAGHQGIRPAAPPEDQNAVQGFRLRAEQAQQRASQLQALSTALEQLYAVLTPEQQRLADPQLAGALP